MGYSLLLNMLAESFLAGEPNIEEIVDRAARTLGRRWKWLTPLARRYVKSFGEKRPRQRDVIRFFRRDSGLMRAWLKYRHELAVDQWVVNAPRMQPVRAAENWNLPAIESSGALAQWLGLSASELRWFADLKGLGYKNKEQQLRHYHYRVFSKTSGGVRLIEAPKPRLKQMQRKILAQILETVPAHLASHGFVKGRSIKTFVAPHVGRRVVLRMDLQNYFPSFSGARIQSFFRTLGYPEAVADLLGGICTNATPRDVWMKTGLENDPVDLHAIQSLYARPHLPQGAPTSPALANLCTYRADCRLLGLAGSVNADYTRYADDLAFSGNDPQFERRIETFSTHVAAILMEEGFRVHFRKTRVMRRGVRQHLAGLVANQNVNVIRADFDRLKATLTNCVREGPESQNRSEHPSFRSHLEGRVGFVEMIHPARGKRLRELFKKIQWAA
jgi:RNA-directed DNA polymerase